MQVQKSRWKKILRWLPGLIISLIAIIAIFKFVNVGDLKTAFSTVSIWSIIGLVFLDIFGMLVRGKAWQVILGKGFTFKQAFFGISEGYFLNNVLPFRAGELGRSFFVGRNSGRGTFYVLSTIVIERAFDLAFAAAMVVLTLPYLTGMDWAKPVATIALILVVAGLFLLFLTARNKEKVLSWVDGIDKKSKLLNFILPKIHNIVEGFSLLANPRQFVMSLLLVGINWVIWTSVYFVAVAQVIPDAPYTWGIFMSGVMALGAAIPSAPASLGVFEGTFVGAMVILGGQKETALAYAIILHVVQFVIVAVFGIWGLVREGVKLNQMFSSFTKDSTEAVTVDIQREEQ